MLAKNFLRTEKLMKGPIITAQKLSELLKSDRKNVCVLDATWFMPNTQGAHEDLFEKEELDRGRALLKEYNTTEDFINKRLIKDSYD